MPYYSYRCQICKHEFVISKKMLDPDPCCPQCNNGVKRIFEPIAIQYRGTGFSKTDDGLKRDRSGRIDDVVPGAS